MRCLSLLCLLLLSAPGTGAETSESLLAEELKDARERVSAELRARITDMEALAETVNRLTEQQDEYIRRLRTHIDALREEGDEG